MKRVVLYRFDRPALEAMVEPASLAGSENIEVMTSGGNLHTLPIADVKAVCLASEPGPFDLFTSNNLFERRPKLPGLWVRFGFRDDDSLEGVLEHNLLDWPAAGFLLTPPNAGRTRQRVFVPRVALTRTEILGTVGKAKLAQPSRTPRTPAGAQLPMFD